MGRTYVVEEPRKEEVEEKEEEGAYYARTILTKVSHRAPLGRRDQTIVCHLARAAARAHAAVAFRTYTYIRRLGRQLGWKTRTTAGSCIIIRSLELMTSVNINARKKGLYFNVLNRFATLAASSM